MNRLLKGALWVGGLAAFAVVVLTGVLGAFAKVVDPGHYCETGFSHWVSCTTHWSSTSTHHSTPTFPWSSATEPPSGSPDTLRPDTVDVTMWAVARCPENYIAKRLLCSGASVAMPVQTASNDLAGSLPVPKPWVVRTAKNSPFIEAVHVETPLDLAAVLGFYRSELSKRGWAEGDGAVVEPDSALIVFTTADGPAQLRLIHQDDRTIADLSRRKLAATDASTAKNSPFTEAVHVETPRDLEAVLGYYRSELNKRGWVEGDGAVVEPDNALITFTTADGPAQLRLVHQDDRTIADLSWRNASILPAPGQARLLFGNTTDEEAIVTINGQTINLPAKAGGKLSEQVQSVGKSRNNQEINLPPGKYLFSFKVASGAVQKREFMLVADETWGLLVGPGGVPLPVHLY
jgi:hypothetical protein